MIEVKYPEVSTRYRISLGIGNCSAFSVGNTYVYMHADLKLKAKRMAKTAQLEMKPA